VHDNPALAEALAAGGDVHAAFIWSKHDDGGQWGIRGAAEVYLKQALVELDEGLEAIGLQCIFRKAVSTFAEEAKTLQAEVNATVVHYNIDHTPEGLARDCAMRAALPGAGVSVVGHEAQLLYAPDRVNLAGGFSGGHWYVRAVFFVRETGSSGVYLGGATAASVARPTDSVLRRP